MESPLVLIHTEDRIATLTLNRPDKRNALGPALIEALHQALSSLAQDPAVKVIVLTGAGKAFCAGADLESLQALQTNTWDDNLADSQKLQALFETIYTLPKPLIARINGHALAGGCGLAALADFSIAVPEAQLGYTEVRIGFIPALVSVFLVRKIGEGKAREILLSGEVFSAEKAAHIGLIGEVVPAEELDARVYGLARTLVEQNSAQSMAATKALLAQLSGLDVFAGLNAAARANATARATPDCQKGIAAFLSKEKVVW